MQRKVLTPNDFTGLDDVADRLLRFQDLVNAEPQPFSWNYTRIQLAQFLTRLNRRLIAAGRPTLSLAA